MTDILAAIDGARRVLVTGSRRWTNTDAIGRALEPYAGTNTVVVHGGANGADYIAARVAESLGLATEEHPADWEHCAPTCPTGHLKQRRADGRPYCPTAGHRRNQAMVDLGAEVCLAFPVGVTWSGTRDCMARAEKAGIPVRDLGRLA